MQPDELAAALDARLHQADRVVGVRVAQWIEEAGLDLHQTRLLLAIAGHDEPTDVATVAEEAGLTIELAYPSVHELDRRGLTRGEHRHHVITDAGRDLIETFTAARRAATASYVAGLDDSQRRRLEIALGTDD